MSQQPRNSIDIPFLGEGAEDFLVDRLPVVGAADFALRERPKVMGGDTRGAWRRFSDWVFDGVLPDSQTNYYGSGDPERKRMLQERAQRTKTGDKPFIDADEGSDARLAADLLVGFADEGTLPMETDPDEELAGEMMLMQASETVNNPDATPDQKGDAASVIGERAIKQLEAKQAAESELAAMSNADDLAKRVVERWADGKSQGEIGEELRAGGWDYSKADKRMFDRLEQEVEILMDEGEFAKAKALTFARLNLMKNGGAPDANVTPYDELLDKYIEADAVNMTAKDAFSIAGTDSFLSTIRGIGRITGMGYTTPHDKDLLEKMTASAFQEHPISSLAGSFTGGFMDPVFFGISMAAAKAPITAVQRSRYIKDLMTKGVAGELAEQLGKKATMETIASARLTNYFLKQGVSLKASQSAGQLVWNISDAAVTNAAAEGVVAAGEGESPTDIGIRAIKGAGVGVVMGVALDRAFAGIGKMNQALTGKVPKDTSDKLDKAISYAAASGDGAAVSRDLRNLTAAWDDASRRLGRRLSTEEAIGIATERGVNLDELVVLRAQQVAKIKAERVSAKNKPAGERAGGQEITEIEREAIERGILKAPEEPLTDAQKRERTAKNNADQDARVVETERIAKELETVSDADLAERAKTAKGVELDAIDMVIADRRGLDRQGKAAGILKDPSDPASLTPEQRRERSKNADAELERRYGPGLDQEEAGKKPGPIDEDVVRVIRKMSPEQIKQGRKNLHKLSKSDREKMIRGFAQVEDERRGASGGFPARMNIDELAKHAAPTADEGSLADNVRLQRGNIENIDHRGDDFVKVLVPVEEVKVHKKAVDATETVEQYRTESAQTRPPIVGGPSSDGSGEFFVADGTRRTLAARANGEDEIAAYVPEWFAKERNYPRQKPADMPTLAEAKAAFDRMPRGENKPESRVDEYIRETELESMTDDELAELRSTMLPKIGSKTEREGAKLAVEAIDRVMKNRSKGSKLPGEATIIDRTPEGFGPDPQEPPALPTPEEADHLAFGGRDIDREVREELGLADTRGAGKTLVARLKKEGFGDDTGFQVSNPDRQHGDSQYLTIDGPEDADGYYDQFEIRISDHPPGRNYTADADIRIGKEADERALEKQIAEVVREARKYFDLSDDIEREGFERGVLRPTPEAGPELTPEQRRERSARADRELEERYGPELAREEQDAASARPDNAGQGTAPAVPDARDAKGPRSDQRPPAPTIDPATGREARVRVPGRSEPLRGRYAIVEANDLIPSHDARQGYAPNKYGDINERPYNDPSEGKALRARVGQIAQKTDPDFLLSDTPTAVDGPPIVNPDLVVLGGNARAMAQQLAYGQNNANAASLNQATRQAAQRFDIDPAQLDRFTNPVLVRVLDEADAGAPGELSRDLNQAFTGSRTADADATSRAAKITPADGVRISNIIGDGTLGEVFNNEGRTTRLLSSMVSSGAYTQPDLDSMLDQRGLLNQAGRRQVENTLLAVAVPDVRRMAELSPAMHNTLIRSLPALTTLRATGIDGREFTDILANALDIVKERRATGATSIDDMLSQASLTPQPWRGDNQALLMARAMDDDKPTALAARFTSMAMIASDDFAGQTRMFDQDPGQGFGDIFGPRSNISGGTERQAPGGITGKTYESVKGVPGDQTAITRRMAAPQSGIDPGIVREPPPSWVSKPPTTRAGKRIVGRIKSDKKGMKYGIRSIAESLTNAIDGLMVRQVREQTSQKNPAHYMQNPHMVRTRSSSEPAWMFHEHGHAISTVVREANPKFLKDFKAELNELALWPGSMASKNSAEEGFAEFIRRTITDPSRMERWPASARIMAAMESANPVTTEAVRDAARAFDVYMQRPLEARWRSYMTDTKSSPGGVKRVLARGMVDYVSRGFAPELAVRRVMVEVRKDAKTMRDGWASVEKIEQRLANTAAEMQPAYQSLNHIGQMVNIALEGPGKVKAGEPTGMRVHATIVPENLAGTFFDRRGGTRGQATAMLSPMERKLLTDAGIKIPAEPTKHGDIVVMTPKSIADAISPIPKDQWPAFETYAQMKATYARIKTRAKEGEAFPFQTQREGAKPADLIRAVLKAEKANPAWSKVFGDLEEIMNATILLDVMSGEIDVASAIKIINAFEHYLPLTRQGEGGPRGIHSGATTAPSANIRRSRGAVNPAEPLLMAMARKIDESVNAYYWNRFAISPIIMAQSLQAMDDVPRMAKVAASRMGIPLQLDTVKMASATPDEVRREIYKYIVEQVSNGSELFNMAPDDLASFTPDDIGIIDGFDLWRKQPPKAVNVLAPNIGGKRHYFQVLDEDLYRIFADGGEQANAVARISEAAFGSTTQGLKNQITQTFAFTLRNLFRDSLTAVLFGRDPAALVPGFYHAVGATAMATGRKPDSLINPELLSRVFRQVTPEDFAKQRGAMMQALTEGLVPRGWRDMNMLHKTLSAPGIAARVLMKPAELKLIVTGQRWLASASETAPRLGAYIVAKRRGLSDEAAQLAADTVTGNFAERPLNASAHSIYRTAGFLNPAMQIFGQQARFFTDPVPARSAAKAATRMGAIATATAGAWAINRLLSDPEDIARNNERTEQERITHMDIKGLRIPFDYGIAGGIQSYTWNTLDELAGGRGVSDVQIAKKIITEVFPHTSINPLELAPMPLKAATEAKMGYSLYRGETLEPPYMQYLEMPERYFDSTPDLYRWVGEMANASPIRIQYFFRNALGVQVDNAVKLLDRIDEGFEVDELASLPEIGRMFSREPIGWNSRSVRDAAEITDRYDFAMRRAKRMAEDPTNDPEAVAEITAMLAKLQPVKDAMLEVQKLYDTSKQAANAGDKEASRELKRRMVEIAREGLTRMQKIEQGDSDE